MRKFGGRVRLVVENYGDSELARRFGVTRYPAVFVDDILVAKPKDFGFYGKGADGASEGEGEGRYTPWRDAKSHERFRADLERMLGQVLAGKGSAVRSEVATRDAESAGSAGLERLPTFDLAGIAGPPVSSARFAGRPVLVEFWATWCPPCRGTLRWLGDLQERRGSSLAVAALAIESDAKEVETLVRELDLPLAWAMATPAVARNFGDLTAVPTLFLFDGEGRWVETFYGAPPDLHARVEAALDRLAARTTARR
jgi:thiol-disulfide isomerase/thioredoxin